MTRRRPLPTASFRPALRWIAGIGRTSLASSVSVLSLAIAGAVIAAPASAQTAPAEGTLPGTQVLQGGRWTGARIPTVASGNSGMVMTIVQEQQRALLDWSKFNIAANEEVRFEQQATDWIALNRIFDQNPSVIAGKITAKGQVWLSNTNGIVFKGTSQINTHTIVATTAAISDPDTLVTAGIPLVPNKLTGAKGSIVIDQGARISAISADTTQPGKIILMGTNVENHGTLEAPDGQVIMAAGETFYLHTPTGARDVRVDVGVENPLDRVFYLDPGPPTGLYLGRFGNATLWDQRQQERATAAGMKVTNTGSVTAARGNISLVGKDLVQNGTLSVTSDVRQRPGSISLRAAWGRDDSVLVGGDYQPNYNAGTITFGGNSLTQATPDLRGAVSQAVEAYLPGDITLAGRDILLESGARILAPSGTVNIFANYRGTDFREYDFVSLPSADRGKQGSLILRDGASIDVSGLRDVAFDASSNVISVELRSNELSVSPLQLGGILEKKVVAVDVRDGTTLIDWTGAANNRELNARQRSLSGGAINVSALGSIVVDSGATLDISGGSAAYASGYIDRTFLTTADGRVVSLADADPNASYAGVNTEKVFQSGYSEGGNAGSVALLAPAQRLFGEVRAETVIGARQVAAAAGAPGPKVPVGAVNPNVAGAAMPIGGSLTIGGNDPTDSEYFLDRLFVTRDENAFTARRKIANSDGTFRYEDRVYNPLTDLPDGASGAAIGTSFVKADFLNGLANVDLLFSESAQDKTLDILFGVAINLQDNGRFNVFSNDLNVAKDVRITVPSGEISFSRGGTLDSGVVLSVAGRWINDADAPANSYVGAVDGGVINFAGTAKGSVVLDASGGGWYRLVEPANPISRRAARYELIGGRGGSILFDYANFGNIAFRMDGLAGGGALMLNLRDFVIGPDGSSAPAGVAYLSDGLIESWGASSISLQSSEFTMPAGPSALGRILARNVLVPGSQTQVLVAAGTVVDQTVLTRITTAGYTSVAVGTNGSILSGTTLAPRQRIMEFAATPIGIATGSDLAPYLRARALTAFEQPASTLDIRTGGRLDIAATAAIDLAANSSLQLTAGGILDIAGDITTHSGQITLSGRQMFVRATAALDASGIARTRPLWIGENRTSGIEGEILSGGTITVSNLSGSGLSLFVDQGAVLDVSGASGALTVTQPTRGGIAARTNAIVGSDAGAIALINAANGYVLGDLRGAAGNASARGAALSFSGILDPSLIAPPARNGTLAFGAGALEDFAAFDTLNIGTLETRGALTLTARRRIAFALDSITGNDDLTIRAPQVSFGSILGGNTSLLGQNASLLIEADTVDVPGRMGFNGFSDVTIVARDELRGGHDISTGQAAARLYSAGPLTVRAGQIYPTTATRLELRSNDRITIDDIGNSSAPLSAGGYLKLEAPRIDQGGTLRAPFGTIELTGETINLLAGSLTSASADGRVILYGYTVDGADWYAPIGSNGPTPVALTAPPEKRVLINGTNVDLQAGAVVDVSGGGDVLATEFVPGGTGQVNVLAQGGVFAVVPSYGADVVGTGQQVYLEAFDGNAAGWYSVLPAQYALVPGGYRVVLDSPAAGSSSRRLQDGSYAVAGKFGERGTSVVDQTYSAFNVMSGGEVRRRSQYFETSGNTFFSTKRFLDGLQRSGQIFNPNPRLSTDAGFLTLQAGQTLNLDGTILARGASGGRGGLIDIASENIAVIGAGSDRTGLNGYLILDPTELSGLGAESLLLGGIRRQGAGGIEVVTGELVRGSGDTVGAGNVVVRNTGATALTGTEILLAANGAINIAGGSVIRATGNGVDSGDITIAPALPARTTGTALPAEDRGAFVRVSNLGDAIVRRTNAKTDGGNLTIGAGAQLTATDSIVLDSTGNTNFAAGATLRAAAITAAGGRVSLGQAPAGTAGLVFDQAAIALLSQATTLRLKSYSVTELFGNVDLAVNGALVLDTGAIIGSGTGRFAAPTLTITNSAAANYTGPVAGTMLTLTGKTVIFDEGNVVLGFADTQVAADRVRFAGAGGRLNAAGTATVRAAEITAFSGASHDFAAAGRLQLVAPANMVAPLPTETMFGANLKFSGSDITLDTAIRAGSSDVALTATGGNVVLEDGALIDVAGSAVTFFDATEYLPGGDVSLSSATGDVRLLAGSSVNVRGGSGGGDAGSLSISAGRGVAQLGGTLNAAATVGFHGGSFAIESASLGDFGALNAKLNDASFTRKRSYSVLAGDAVIDGVTRAEQFVLSTGQGSVTVKGGAQIVTTGDKGGEVKIISGGALTVESGALIDVSAKGADDRGGTIQLGVGGNGVLSVGNAIFNVRGSGTQQGGEVQLRAPQLATAQGVAVTSYGAQVQGGRTVLEAYKVTDLGAGNGTINTALQNSLVAQATTWFNANAGAIRTRLGQPDSAAFVISPGIEVRAGGDITLANSWNLATARFGAGRAPGVLTLRAGGDLKLDNALSDGVTGATFADTVLTNDQSWSYNLVAGADLARTDVMSTLTSATGAGDIVLKSLVRTGTGDINIALSGDLLYPDDLLYYFNQFYQIVPGTATTARSEMYIYYPDNSRFTFRQATSSTLITVANVPVFGSVTWRPTITGTTTPTFATTFGNVFLADPRNPNGPRGVLPVGVPASIYTVGVDDVRVIPDFNTVTSGHYLKNGGDVRLTVGGSIVGKGDTLLRNNFVARYGNVQDTLNGIDRVSADKAFAVQTAETILVQNFRHSIGALGGGDVSVVTGGNIDNVSISLPTTTRVGGGLLLSGNIVSPKIVYKSGGGDLTVRTGGNILGGWYATSSGAMTIDVAGSVGATPSLASVALGVNNFNTFANFVTDTGQIDLIAGGDIELARTTSMVTGMGIFDSVADRRSWISFDENTSMRFLSVGGDITHYGASPYLPNDYSLVAANGSIVIAGALIADSLPDDGLSLLAQERIGFYLPVNPAQFALNGQSFPMIGSILTSSVAPDYVSRVVNPWNRGLYTTAFTAGRTADDLAGRPNPQAGRNTYARIYAVNGDVGDPSVPGIGQGSLNMGYETRIRAGGNVRMGSVDFQTHDADDLSLVEAGGSIYFPNFLLRGEGDLWVQAGGEVFFGNTPGSGIRTYFQPENEGGQFGPVTTRGENGGDITVLAGINQAPDYAKFFDYYLARQGLADKPGYLSEYYVADANGLAIPRATMLADGATEVSIYALDLVNYMRELRGEAAIAATDDSGRPLSRNLMIGRIGKAEYDRAVADFAALEPLKQRGLAQTILMAEVKTSGREAVGASPDTDPRNQRFDNPNRGYAAIGRLYPGAQKNPSEALGAGESRWAGNLIMVNSQIRSDGGGDVNVIAPGGILQLASLSVRNTSPSNAGIVTQLGGAVSVLAGGDIAINQSRIITADDGDILVWTSFGDIDAGNGAKTSIAIPPVRYATSTAGSTSVLRNGIPNGAGIASLDRVDGSLGGDVDLYAFNGLVDSGDAGIRASRDLFIGAIEIRGLDNITIGGRTNVDLETDTGEVGPLNLENFARAAEDKAIEDAFNIADEVRKLRTVRQTIVTGSVVSFGIEEDPSGDEDEDEKKKRKTRNDD